MLQNRFGSQQLAYLVCDCELPHGRSLQNFIDYTVVCGLLTATLHLALHTVPCSQVDRRSCSPSETASGPFPMAAGPVHIPEEVMKQLVAVSQAELVVQSLEANFTTHPTVVSQISH